MHRICAGGERNRSDQDYFVGRQASCARRCYFSREFGCAGRTPACYRCCGGVAVHAIADHCIVELIVNNATAFVVYAYPKTTTGNVGLSGLPATATGAGTIDVWTLKTANNQ
jgi:hypothetical protein